MLEIFLIADVLFLQLNILAALGGFHQHIMGSYQFSACPISPSHPQNGRAVCLNNHVKQSWLDKVTNEVVRKKGRN